MKEPAGSPNNKEQELYEQKTDISKEEDSRIAFPWAKRTI